MKLKMSQILEEADQKLQITGSYLTRWDEKTQKAEGYCAVGLLACKSDSVGVDGWVMGEDKFLINKYGVTKSQVEEIIKCPACLNGDHCRMDYSRKEPNEDTIVRIIIHMNDGHKLTYKQIATYLKQLKY